MANIRFVIRRPEEEKLQPIYVTCRFGRNEKLFYSTPLKVSPVFWDAERQRVRNSRYFPLADDINSALTSLSSVLEKRIISAVREGVNVDKAFLKDVLDTHLGKKRGDDFHSFYEQYIKECETRMNSRRGGQVITYKTQREYIRTLYYINMYEQKRGLSLCFDDIDQKFLADFVSFLQGLNLSTNTIWHKTVSVKAVMRAAYERGLTDNDKWRFFRNVSEETEAVVLDEDELESIRTSLLPERLARIRDLFLLECWTGLRYSDVVRLNDDNIHDGMIIIRQQKTDNFVTIPVHPVFKEIWERYRGVPVVLSNQKFNDNIKEVCRLSGICGSVFKSITKGGRKVTTKYEKWELVSSHTGRRSFATNLYKSGFPSLSIMQVTGHRTESSFLKYIRVTKEEHARLLAEHWKKH